MEAAVSCLSYVSVTPACAAAGLKGLTCLPVDSCGGLRVHSRRPISGAESTSHRANKENGRIYRIWMRSVSFGAIFEWAAIASTAAGRGCCEYRELSLKTEEGGCQRPRDKTALLKKKRKKEGGGGPLLFPAGDSGKRGRAPVFVRSFQTDRREE